MWYFRYLQLHDIFICKNPLLIRFLNSSYIQFSDVIQECCLPGEAPLSKRGLIYDIVDIIQQAIPHLQVMKIHCIFNKCNSVVLNLSIKVIFLWHDKH